MLCCIPNARRSHLHRADADSLHELYALGSTDVDMASCFRWLIRHVFTAVLWRPAAC